MALRLKQIVQQMASIPGGAPGMSISGLSLLEEKYPESFYVLGLDPEGGDPVNEIIENWIVWGVEVLGETRERMVQFILAAFDAPTLFGTVPVQADLYEIPGYRYRYINNNLFYMAPFLYYSFGDVNSADLLSSIQYTYSTLPRSGDACNTLVGEGIVEILQYLGYEVTENTTVGEFRDLVGITNYEAQLTIIETLVQGGDNYYSYWDNPDVCWTDDMYQDAVADGFSLPGSAPCLVAEDDINIRTSPSEMPLFLELSNGLYAIVSISGGQYGPMVPYWGDCDVYRKRGTTIEKVSIVSSDTGNENLFVLLTNDIEPVSFNVGDGLTPEEIVNTWPQFAKYFEDDAPIGLSATKKHFIRVI